MAGRIEDRREVRYPFPHNLLINQKIMVKGIDISYGGLYVNTGRSFDVGRIVEVTIPNYKLTFKARVQHNQAGVGMGLKFLAMNDELKRKIKLLIQSLDMGTVPQGKSRPEVLLVDDNESARRINKSKLNMEGFTVFEASGGVEAIKKLKEVTPDIIVLDINMSDMDGLKMLHLIRTTEKWARIPVVMFSSLASSELIGKAYEAGANEFLPKSTTSPAKLAMAVKTILDHSK